MSRAMTVAVAEPASTQRLEMYERCLRAAESIPREPVVPRWLADGKRFWYATGRDKQTIYLVDPEANTKESVVDPAGLKESSAKPSRRELGSPDGTRFVSEREFNVHLRFAEQNQTEPLTRDGVRDHGWRLEEARWSPSGSHLAISKEDQRGVPAVPVVNWLKPQIEVTWVRRPCAGAPLPRVELFSLDVEAHRCMPIDTGSEPDRYVHIKAWLPDGSGLLFTRADRTLQKLDLMLADTRTGSSKTLLTETSDTSIDTWLADIQYERLFVDARRFLWLSERDGWRHIYLYDLEGQLLKRLTSGDFPIVRVITVDEKRGWVYFTAHTDRKRPYDTHLCRVDLSGERLECLTKAPGQHGYSGVHPSWRGGITFSPSQEYFIDTHSALDRTPEVVLCHADGTALQVLEKIGTAGFDQPDCPAPEEFTVKAADGATDLYGVLYKPFDFDPSRKYPVVDNLYNAPWSTWVPTIFNDPRGTEAQALAQLGFVVVMLDGRGTPERSKAFRDYAYGRLGQIEIADHVAALRQLAAGSAYLDLDRVGIVGGSWGGYLAVRALLTEPDFYRVGVALSPLLEQRSGSPGRQEPYMGLPQSNPAGYDAGSNLALAQRLKGKLLIVQGTSDVNVSFADVMKMVSSLTESGKACDLVVLPGQPHDPTGRSRDRWRRACRDYFQEHLRP